MVTAEDRTPYFEQLEKLAEMGQVNAIQSWYHMHNVGDNSTIDKIVEGMNDENDFNQLYAKSLYLSKTPEISSEYAKLLQEFNSLISGEEVYEEGHLKNGSKRAEELLHQITKLPHISKMSMACKLAERCGAEQGDPIFNERANEIFAEVQKLYPLPSGKKKMGRTHYDINHDTKIRLSASFPKTPREKKSTKNYSQLLYYLARSFEKFDENLLIAKNATCTEKELVELAERKYSKAFAKKLTETKSESGE